MDETREVDNGEMGAVRAADLDPQDVLGEGFPVYRDAHGELGVLDDAWEVVETAHLRFETTQGLALRLIAGVVRDDGHLGTDIPCTSQDQFGGKAGAEIALDGKRNAGDGLQDGALARRLVSADDDLGERDVVVDALVAEIVDGVEELKLVCRAQLAHAVAVKRHHG